MVKLWLFCGIAAYFAACIAGIYFLTGQIVGEGGFQGLLWGSVGGFLAIVAIFAVTGGLVKKLGASSKRRNLLKVAQALLVLGLTAAFAPGFLTPLMKRDPAYYRYGGPESQYTVTYGSGRTEQRSGADLGAKAWGWDMGLYFAITLVLGAVSLYELGSGLLALRRENSLPHAGALLLITGVSGAAVAASAARQGLLLAAGSYLLVLTLFAAMPGGVLLLIMRRRGAGGNVSRAAALVILASGLFAYEIAGRYAIFPVYNKERATLGFLAAIGSALSQYIEDHDGNLPHDFRELTPRYLAAFPSAYTLAHGETTGIDSVAAEDFAAVRG